MQNRNEGEGHISYHLYALIISDEKNCKNRSTETEDILKIEIAQFFSAHNFTATDWAVAAHCIEILTGILTRYILPIINEPI